MRLASFNVENLFARAAALSSSQWVNETASDLAPWSDGRKALDAYSKLNAIFAKPLYSAADKTAILSGLRDLGLENRDESALVILRRNRGSLLKRPVNGPVQVVANGRGDWIGWLELKKEAVNEIATQNTARVINAVGADVLVVIEADDRTSLCRFNDQIVTAVGGNAYDHIMLIDGNDERGIDVGIFIRTPIEIGGMRSHVDDRAASGGPLFSRDCPEFHLDLGRGKRMCVLANHLKSKGYGTPAQSNAKRKAQAKRVRQIYQQLRADGIDQIAIMGDFNDTLASDPLSPLLGGSDLQDVSAFAGFQDGGRKGTFGNCTASNKIDHILLSPALMAKVTAGGIERRGAWGGVHGTLWPHFPEVTKVTEAASDHVAIWVDLNV